MASTRPGGNGSFQPEFIIIPYAVFTDPNLLPVAKLVYGRLKLYAGKKGEARPKQETLAQEVCLKRRQLQKVLRQLRDAGWISWDRGSKNCTYTVHPDVHSSAHHETPEIGTRVRITRALECASQQPLYRKEKKFEKMSPLTPQGEDVVLPDQGPSGTDLDPQPELVGANLDPQPAPLNGHAAAKNGTGRGPKVVAAIQETAARIQGRHPSAFGRRDCSAAQVEKHLAAILKHQHIPVVDQAAYLEQIDRNHAAMCASESWQKEGGQFAKGLENWLAPTKERYLVEPPPAAAPPTNGVGYRPMDAWKEQIGK
jgi:hypothetical protein